MSSSIFTVGKVIKAVQTLPDGSKVNTIAACSPNGTLAAIANLTEYKRELERLAEDEKMDMNYAAFQVIGNKAYYVPVEDLHGILKKLDKPEEILKEEEGLLKLECLKQVSKMLPVVKSFVYGPKDSFAII